MNHFVRYPLASRFTLHHDGGRTARRVRMLAGTSDWRRDLLDRLGSAAVAVVGTRPWPTTTAWPWPSADPPTIEAALGELVDRITIVAAAAPRQHGRARLSLLGRVGIHDVVVKLGRPDDGIEVESAALELLTSDPLPGILTPRVIGSGRVDVGEPIAVLVTTALGIDGQRPAIDEPLRTFTADLAERLAVLPKPLDTPDEAVPVHGDLAPWNLRRTSRGLALFDWEAAGWEAPGSDLDHYRRTCAELRR